MASTEYQRRCDHLVNRELVTTCSIVKVEDCPADNYLSQGHAVTHDPAQCDAELVIIN